MQRHSIMISLVGIKERVMKMKGSVCEKAGKKNEKIGSRWCLSLKWKLNDETPFNVKEPFNEDVTLHYRIRCTL